MLYLRNNIEIPRIKDTKPIIHHFIKNINFRRIGGYALFLRKR